METDYDAWNNMSKLVGVVLALMVISISIAPAVALTDKTTPTENSWVSKAPMQQARCNLGAAVVDGKIYAIGGVVITYQDKIRTDTKVVGTNEEYDPATNTWTYKAPMPIPSSDFAIAVYQNKIYCIGGGVTRYLNMSKGNWDVKFGEGFNQVYDPATDTWGNKTAMPIPQDEAQANVVGDKIYFLRGYPNRTLNWVYDPVTDNWTQNSSMPKGFSGSSAVYLDKIYVVGSYVISSNDPKIIPSSPTPMTQIYDPKQDTWAITTTTGPLSYQKVVVATSGIEAPPKIYALYNPYSAPSAYIYETQVFDPETNSWENAAGIPTERNSFAVAVVDDLIYVIGGWTIIFSIPTTNANPTSITTMYATVERYTPFGYGSVPPVVSVDSLKSNVTFTSSNIPLVFSLNKPAVWVGYSLDGNDNVTVVGNSTLSGLSAGLHNVTVFAKDDNENVGASETIVFTVAPEPFLSLTVVIAVAVLVVVVCVGLFLYFKKHKG
jgi:hypothetical protein